MRRLLLVAVLAVGCFDNTATAMLNIDGDFVYRVGSGHWRYCDDASSGARTPWRLESLTACRKAGWKPKIEVGK